MNNHDCDFEAYVMAGGNICTYTVHIITGSHGASVAMLDDHGMLKVMLTNELPLAFAKGMRSSWNRKAYDRFSVSLRKTYDVSDITPAGVMFFNELWKRNLHSRGLRPIDPDTLKSLVSVYVHQHYQSVYGSKIQGTKATTVITDDVDTASEALPIGGGVSSPVEPEAQLFAGHIIKDRGFKPDEAKPDAMDITRQMIRGN